MCISNKKSKIEHNKIFVISTNTMTTFDLTLLKGEAITNIFYGNLISKVFGRVDSSVACMNQKLSENVSRR